MKNVGILIIFAMIFFNGCGGQAAIYGGSADSIRVLVLKGVKRVELKGAKKIKFAAIERTDKGVEINGRGVRLPLKFTPKQYFIYVNNKPYRGIIELRDDKDGFIIINELPLESYVIGIINNEISSKWHREAIKAQAVVARTYALYQKEARKNQLYDLTATHMDQVYSGADKEDNDVRKAVKATGGEALYYDGQAALTLYHSNAGGATEDDKEVWTTDYPYLTMVESPHDSTGSNYNWEVSLSGETLKGVLNGGGYLIDDVESILVKERSSTGRARVVQIEDVRGNAVNVSGEDLRKAVGYAILRSTIFEVKKTGDGFLFKGRGSGHGVGMSQWGAKGMAGDGYKYKEILKHFYPGTSLKKAY